MYQTDVCQVCLPCLMPCSAALGKHSWARKLFDPDPDRKGIQMKRFGSKSAIAFRMCAWARHCPAMSLWVLVQWHRKTKAMDKSNSLSGCFFRTLGNPRLPDNWTARLACGSNFSQASNTPGPCSVQQQLSDEVCRAVDIKLRQSLTVIIPTRVLAAEANPPHFFFEFLLLAFVWLLLDELFQFLLLSVLPIGKPN